MYYHAMRASSAAMCSTWVWAVSGPVCGLPLLFPSVSVLYVPVRFLMLDLLYMFSGRVLVVLGFQPFVDMSFKWTSRRNPELTASVWMWTNSCINLTWCINEVPFGNVSNWNLSWITRQSMDATINLWHICNFGYGDVFNFKPQLKQPIDIWMQ